MNATEVKPSLNGVVKIARRGRAKLEFDEGDTFEVDVIAVYDQWYEIDWSLRDEKGVLPHNKQDEWGQNRLNFVQAVVNDAYAKIGKQAPMLCRAEAEAFIVEITKKKDELRNFFQPSTGETSSSPENLGNTEIRFSQ